MSITAKHNRVAPTKNNPLRISDRPPTTRTHFDVLRRPRQSHVASLFPLGITQSCVVESDTAVYYEPQTTWEVVVVAFKLGSSFLEDRNIERKKKHWH